VGVSNAQATKVLGKARADATKLGLCLQRVPLLNQYGTSADPSAFRPVKANARLTVQIGTDLDPHWTVDGVGGRGLFIRHTLPPALIFAVGASLRLLWHDSSGRLLLDVRGRVRDSDETGARLQLENASDEMVAMIQAFSQREVAAAPRRSEPNSTAPSRKWLDLIARDTELGMRERCQRLLQQAATGLDQIALGTMMEIAGIPARVALELLHTASQGIVDQFVQEVAAPWKASPPAAAAPAAMNFSLRLVDDDEMQTWLKRSESARTLERSTQSTWQSLKPLLEAVTQPFPGLDCEALSIESILGALANALKSPPLEPAMQQFLLRLAGHPEILDLSAFYQQLQLELQRAGVPSPAAPGINRLDTGAAMAPATTRPDLPASGYRPIHAEQVPTPRVVRAPTPTPANAMATTHRIWSLGQASPPTSAPATGQPPTLVPDSALVQALRGMLKSEHHNANAADFREQLQQQAAALAGDANARPDPRQSEAIELLGRLQQAIDADPLLPPGFRGWSRPLLAPILATQLQPEGLTESGESLRQLFSLIEFGSVLCAERQDAQTLEIRRSIEATLESLGSSERLTPEQLTAACARLEQMLHRHRKAGTAIEDRVVDSCVGQQRLVEARQLVHKELAIRFGGRELPKALDELVEQRLAALMLLTVLRMGPGGSEWPRLKGRIEHLDNALRLAAEGQPAIDIEHYLGWIREAFADDAADLTRLNGQLNELSRALRGESVPWVRYHASTVESAQELPAPVAAERDKDAIGERLALLQPGDWLAFGTTDADTRVLKLAWRAPDQSRFVFVSQLGHKAQDLSHAQLRAALVAGHARVVDEGDASIIERAWRRMLEEMHNELAEQATHDPLTGLLNRKELDRRLLIWMSARQRAPMTILWIGVDHLRLINQSHGMGAGDHVLSELARTVQHHLSAAQPRNHFAARMAGDEFVVVLQGISKAESERQAQLLLDQLNAVDLQWEGAHFHLSVSIGMAVADENCTSTEKLVGDAEHACRAAKDSGRGKLYMHQANDSLLSQMRETVNWVGRVEHSLQTNSLVLYGQRAMSLSAAARHDPDYLEVLLRMRTDDGVALPGDFIVAAERYGQIMALDRFVVQELTRSLQSASRTHNLRIAFNVSARNIVDPAFIEEIIDTLKQQPLPMSRLCVELTETAAIQQLAEACSGMKRLSEAGLSMVLDDFGSGWSSYQYLRRLPFDVVKVDGAFIRDIAHSAEDRAMAQSINEIAHLLGKRTVAEHVENQETLDQVREIGFDYAQGYFIGMPSPLSELLGAR
jgi:diguanylate cyclase (GGDEF)-like protein